MNRFSKNSAITFFSRALVSLLSFLILMILARTLGPEKIGIYTLIILFPQMAFRLGNLGIGVANIYHIGSKRYKLDEVISNSIIFTFISSLVLILIIFGVLQTDSVNGFLNTNGIDKTYLWLVTLTFPFSLLTEAILSIFLGKEDIVKYNRINIFRKILQLALVVLLLIILKQGLLGAVVAYSMTGLVVVAVVLMMIRKLSRIKLIYNIGLFKNSIAYGIKAYLGNIAQFLNYRLDMFLVAVFLSPVEVGYYGIAVVIVENIWMLPGAIATVLLPRIASIKTEEANSLTPRVASHTFFITIIISVFVALFANIFIKIFFGTNFLAAVLPLLILLPGVIVFSVTKTLSADLAGRGKPQLNAYVSFISLAINIPLNILFIPKWGISGAALASSIAYSVATVVTIMIYTRVSKRSWKNILIMKRTDLKLYSDFINSVFRKKI